MNALFDRYAAIPALAITSSVAYTLLALQVSGYRGSEALSDWSRSHKTTVTIAVQLLSHMLGLLHVNVTCTLIKVSLITSLQQRPFALYWAQFVRTVAVPLMSWNLPRKQTILLLLVIICSFIPAAIWAPALVPLSAERNVTQFLDIPTFNVTNISSLWDTTHSNLGQGDTLYSQKGMFSFEPAVIKGLLMTSASDASVMTNGQYVHSKLDKTGFSYSSRSQGAGSIAGYQQFPDVEAPQWYTYMEDAFTSKISCFYTNNITLWVTPVLQQNNFPGLYQSYGVSPLGTELGFNTYMAYNDQDVFSWQASRDEADRAIFLQFATLANQVNNSWGFADLNGIQCTLNFTLNQVSVSVNTTSKLITSTLTDQPSFIWPTYGDAVLDEIGGWLGDLSWLDGACIGGCPLGRSIVGNVRNLQMLTGDNSNATTLRAVEDYLADVTDNTIVELLLTRMIFNASDAMQQVSATVAAPSVTFGDPEFVAIVAFINTVVTVAYLFELVRTRAWSDLPDLDISDVSSVVICAMRGGVVLARSIGDGSREILSDRTILTKETKVRLVCEHSAAHASLLVPLLGGQASLSSTPSVPSSHGKLDDYSNNRSTEQAPPIIKRKAIATW